MTEDGGTPRRSFDAADLVQLRSAMSTIGWGYALATFMCGPVFVSPAGRIAPTSVLGAVVVMVGLVRLPMRHASAELDRLRWLVVGMALASWACGVAVFIPVMTTVAGALGWIGATCSAVALVLFLALITRLCLRLGATAAVPAWRRLTCAVLALVGLVYAVWAVGTVALPHVPGASPARPESTDLVYSGYAVTGATAWIAVALLVTMTAGAVLALVLAVQAFGALKRWITAQLPTAPNPWATHEDTGPRDTVDVGDAALARRRVVGGRVVLLVDRDEAELD